MSPSSPVPHNPGDSSADAAVVVSRPAIEVGAPASSTPIAGWAIAPAAGAGASQSDGEEISSPDYTTTTGWLDAAARSTVIAALIASGRYPHIERSTNLRDLVDPADFAIPWWYRGEFVAHGTARTTLRLDGVLHKADLFVNGQLFASNSEIAGAYAAASLDVTKAVEEGLNAFALRAYPGDPISDLTINWWDWNQAPRVTTSACGGTSSSSGPGPFTSNFRWSRAPSATTRRRRRSSRSPSMRRICPIAAQPASSSSS
jgi:exo-1,4-beta-D-glucosaminidase